MKKNQLRTGLRGDKKLKRSFYHFIVDNRIDWAIILGAFFCMLPYLGSQDWYWILSKSILLMTVIYFALRYLKTWNALRDVDLEMNKAREILNPEIKKGGNVDSDSIIDFLEELTDKTKMLGSDYKGKLDNYKDFMEYLKYDKEVPTDVEDFLNKDPELTVSALKLSMGIYLYFNELRVLPKLRLKNYYRLLAIILVVIIYFVLNAIENSQSIFS